MMMPEELQHNHHDNEPSPPSHRHSQQPQPHRTHALWTVAGGAAGVLLLLLVATWRVGPDDGGTAGGGGRLRLFRRPGLPNPHPEGEGRHQQQQREPPSSSLRRPGTALGTTDVLWGLEPRCFDALYHGKQGDAAAAVNSAAACGCGVASAPAAAVTDGPRPLAFADENPTDAVRAGAEARFTLRAAHACSDVLNAAFHSRGDQNALGREVTVPARVVALDGDDGGGQYAVTATLPSAGTYTLKAWVLWEGFAPRVECRESPCRRCWESVAPRYTSGAVSRTVRVVGGDDGVEEKDGKQQQQHRPPPPPLLPVCTTLESMMDGAWVQDPTLLYGYHDRVREEGEAATITALLSPPPAGSTNSTNSSAAAADEDDGGGGLGLYARMDGAWVPHACRLPLHSPQTLRRALAGWHLHFVGDSTTREFMHGAMRLLWPESAALGHDHAWVPNDYDSGANYTTRFSFNWVGGAATNDSMKGLAALVQSPQRFLRSLPRNADVVFLSAGTHDVAGRRAIPGYTAALATVFDWVAARVPAVGKDPRRAVWRPALPLLSQFHKPGAGFVNGSCRQEHGAALQWMRLLGAREARKRGFGVLDGYRVAEAEDVRRAWGGELPCSRDGMHYAGCDCYTALLAVFLHHVLGLVGGKGGEGEGEGVRGLEGGVREAECGLVSCS